MSRPKKAEKDRMARRCINLKPSEWDAVDQYLAQKYSGLDWSVAIRQLVRNAIENK